MRGLDAGADDYVAKPFSAEVMLARIRARLRRTGTLAEAQQRCTEAGPDARSCPAAACSFAGKRCCLRQRSTVSSSSWSRTPVVPVTSYLLERVWDIDRHEPHLVWQVIRRLRQKIERNPDDPEMIQTRPGIGYVLCPTLWEKK